MVHSRLHRLNPSHCVFRYCFCKQDTKELYWGQQFCQMERDISVRRTKMTRPIKVDRTGPFHLMYQPKFPEFWVEWKVPLGIELWPSRKEGRAITDSVNPYFFPLTNSKEGTGNKVREVSISCHYTFTYLVQASSFHPATSAPRRACSQVITY